MFEEIDRPPRCKRNLMDDDMNWDADVEEALTSTLQSGRAVKMSLSKFHSSPAKGRLWKQGYAVRHRVLKDRETVAAWIVPDPRINTEAIAAREEACG